MSKKKQKNLKVNPSKKKKRGYDEYKDKIEISDGYCH